MFGPRAGPSTSHGTLVVKVWSGFSGDARARSGKVCSGFPKRSCSNKKLERDDDSKKSHPALARRDVTLRPVGACAVAKACESSLCNRVPHALHQVLVIRDIDFRQQHRPQRLARLDQMMQIGARAGAGGRPWAFLVERPWVVGVAGVAQVDLTEPRVPHPGTPIAPRHPPTEHVDAAPPPLKQIFGRAPAP